MITNIIEVVIGTIIGMACYNLFWYLFTHCKTIMDSIKWQNSLKKAFFETNPNATREDFKRFLGRTK